MAGGMGGGGACTGPQECDDQDPCTADACDAFRCVHSPLHDTPATPVELTLSAPTFLGGAFSGFRVPQLVFDGTELLVASSSSAIRVKLDGGLNGSYALSPANGALAWNGSAFVYVWRDTVADSLEAQVLNASFAVIQTLRVTRDPSTSPSLNALTPTRNGFFLFTTTGRRWLGEADGGWQARFLGGTSASKAVPTVGFGALGLRSVATMTFSQDLFVHAIQPDGGVSSEVAVDVGTPGNLDMVALAAASSAGAVFWRKESAANLNAAPVSLATAAVGPPVILSPHSSARLSSVVFDGANYLAFGRLVGGPARIYRLTPALQVFGGDAGITDREDWGTMLPVSPGLTALAILENDGGASLRFVRSCP